MQAKEVGSGALQRQQREKLLEAARRREIDVVVVWRLGPMGKICHRSTGYSTGVGIPQRRLRVAHRGAGPDHNRRVAQWPRCWPSSPASSARYLGTTCAPVSLMPGRAESGSAALYQSSTTLLIMRTRHASRVRTCIVAPGIIRPLSDNARRPAVIRSTLRLDHQSGILTKPWATPIESMKYPVTKPSPFMLVGNVPL
jgi:hypothetical protein